LIERRTYELMKRIALKAEKCRSGLSQAVVARAAFPTTCTAPTPRSCYGATSAPPIMNEPDDV
jgi:hypothetical protein